MLDELEEKRADHWTDEDDKSLAQLLKEQADKDKAAHESEKNEKQKGDD